MRFTFPHFSIFLLFLLLPIQLKAATDVPRLYVLSSVEDDVRNQVMSFLFKYYSSCCLVTYTENFNLLDKEPQSRLSLLITLGSGALKLSSSINKFSKLALLVNREDFQLHTSGCGNCSAVLNDPDFRSQITEIRRVIGEHRRGVIYYRDPHWANRDQAGLPDGFTLKQVEDTKQLIKEIKSFEGDLLVSVPDKNLYNPQSNRFIIRSLYRKGIMFFGQSESQVRMGAVASVVPTEEELFVHIENKIDIFLEGGKMGEPEYIKSSNLVVNRVVAQSFDLNF